MPKYWLVLAVGLGVGAHAFAQAPDLPPSYPATAPRVDTTYALPSLTVLGRLTERYAAGSRVTTLDSTLLATQNVLSLGDLLARHTPLYVKNYGPGQLASVSFRGTSANQTAVLWHGLLLNSPTFGSSDFSILPAVAVEQVAVQHGNASAAWGSGSVGGAVLLGSAPDFRQGLSASLQADHGSFGQWATNGRLRVSTGKVTLTTRAWQQGARNDFPYRDPTALGSPEVRQPNAAFRQWGLTQDAELRLSRGGLLALRGWYTATWRQAQPAMVEVNSGNQRTDDNLRLLAEWQQPHRLGTTTAKAAYFRDGLRWNEAPSTVHTWQAQAQHEVTLGQKLLVKAGAEVQHFRAWVSDNYDSTETRQAYFFLTRYQPHPRLELSLNVRQALVSGYQPPLTPALGANWHLIRQPSHRLTLKASLSRGYRVPTLHDRFWRPGGNPALRPETSLGGEMGLAFRQQKATRLVAAELTIFRNDIADYLFWRPTGQGIWSPQNLSAVRTQGAELTASLARTGRWHTGLSYALTAAQQTQSRDADDALGRQLTYVPLHRATWYATGTHHHWTATLDVAFTSQRAMLAYTGTLPAFALGNATLGRNLAVGKVRLCVLARVNNVLNTSYQTYQYYAMPGRHYGLSVRVDWNR